MSVNQLSAGVRDALTDTMFDTARSLLRRHPLGATVTAATIQNALRVGYNRASWMLEAMEHLGLVSSADAYNRRVVVSHQLEKA